MTTKADIEAGALKANARDVMQRGAALYRRYTHLQDAMQRLAAGESYVKIHHQPEYTYRRLSTALNFVHVSTVAGHITVYV